MRLVGLSRDERFAQVYRDCLRDVKTYAWSHVGHVDGDDVVSATFMSVWQRLDDMPLESPRAWVLGVCRNHCRNRWRSNRRFGALIGEIENAHLQLESALAADGVDVDTALAVQSVIAGLTADERELFVLSVWLEYAPTEIGELQGVPGPTVRVRLHRLREKLARRLGDGGEVPV